MQARSQAATPLAGDLSARTAYADSEREAKVPPTLLEQWMPAFLAQLAAPGAQRWQDAGRLDISTVRLRVTPHTHTYWIGDGPALCWEHRLT